LPVLASAHDSEAVFVVKKYSRWPYSSGEGT
jgi:hypothetical protein